MASLFAAVLRFLAARLLPLFGLSRIGIMLKSLFSTGFFTVALPLAINWGLFKITQILGPRVFSSLGLSPQTMALTGLSATIASWLQLPLAFSVFMGFVAKAYIVKFAKMGGIFSKFTNSRWSN